jgi:hypothetical protein
MYVSTSPSGSVPDQDITNGLPCATFTSPAGAVIFTEGACALIGRPPKDCLVNRLTNSTRAVLVRQRQLQRKRSKAEIVGVVGNCVRGRESDFAEILPSSVEKFQLWYQTSE